MTTNGDAPFRVRIGDGSVLQGVGPLERAGVEARIKEFFNNEYHANLFLMWEIKRTPNHPENDRIIKEFVDILVQIGIVR